MNDAPDIIRRNNVNLTGNGDTTLLMAHGFGCDQHMWRFVTPALGRDHRIVLFDYVGSGHSELAAYDHQRYSSLEGYAEDIIEICEHLELDDVVLVGHSVSSMIGLIAAINRPAIFERLIMICPTPCFLNKPDYAGGFDPEDLEELFDLMDKNYIGWANYLAPLVMGTNSNEELRGELSGSFCSTDPLIAKDFARATFCSDYRHLLPQARHPSLLLQSETDALASIDVGHYMDDRMPESELRILPGEGHCLHMTHPERVVDEIQRYLSGQGAG